MTPVDVLKNVLEPSLKIDDKYRTYLFELKSGKVVTGMVVDESGDEIKVIENPLASKATVVVRKSDVAERAKSPSSIMPKGLLDKLTREEALDLLAYIISRGDAASPVFSAGGHRHEGH